LGQVRPLEIKLQANGVQTGFRNDRWVPLFWCQLRLFVQPRNNKGRTCLCVLDNYPGMLSKLQLFKTLACLCSL